MPLVYESALRFFLQTPMPSIDEKTLSMWLQMGAMGILFGLVAIGLILAWKHDPNAGKATERKDDDVKLALAGLADKALVAADKNATAANGFMERQTATLEANTKATEKLVEAQVNSVAELGEIKQALLPLQGLITQVSTMENNLATYSHKQDEQITLFNIAIQGLNEAREAMKRIQDKRRTTQDLPPVPNDKDMQ